MGKIEAIVRAVKEGLSAHVRPSLPSNPPTTGAEVLSVLVDSAGTSRLSPLDRETLTRMSEDSDGDFTPDYQATRARVARELGYDDE